MSVGAIVLAAMKIITAILDVWQQGQLDQTKLDAATTAAIAALTPVGPPS
jgi:hypothetical protein